MTVLIYAMIYAGSAIMVYNIVRYYSFLRKMRALGDWDRLRLPATVPLALLVSFLVGYLTVGAIGSPDLVVAGILFGGSLFVLIVLAIMMIIIGRLIESNARANALFDQTKRSLDSLTKDCLAVFRVNLTKDVVEERGGTNLYDSDLTATSYSELLDARRQYVIAETASISHDGAFTRDGLLARFENGETSAEEVVFCHLRDGQVSFVSLKATLVAQPDTGDVLAFITESLCNEEAVNDVLLHKALIEQYDMIAYLVEGRYGVVIGDEGSERKGVIMPKQKNGSYWDYLAEQVAPVVSGSSLENIQTISSLGLNRVERELAVHEPYEVNVTCKVDGETYYKRFVFYVVDREAHFYLLLKSDTTELIRQEMDHAHRLKSALDEARLASEAKSTFLANMSHDIRTPMNAIVGYSELAHKAADIDQAREYLDKIDSSSKYLLTLINDVLEMSRIESGNLDLQIEPLDLAAVMEDARGVFEPQMAAKSIAFSVDASQVREPHVLCDKARLERILVDFLSNACKFTPEGGSVDVMLVQMEDANDGRARYELRVKDTGIGMSPEFAEKVFEAFERERNTTISGIQGTGLGMAITKRVVDAMGGSITVNTQLGQGTEFVVQLALQRAGGADGADGAQGQGAGAGAGGQQAGEAVDFNGMRILLAEDNEINMEIATFILEDMGFTVEAVEDGQQALALLTSLQPGHFDLVVTDIQMPVMDGYQEARAIRALDDPRLSSIPIVAMSANTFAEDVQKGFDAGMNAYLAKPIDPPTVEETLASLFR